jgi:polyisoprenoid-binding protein YceI
METSTGSRRRRRAWLVAGIGVVVVALLAFVVAPFVYIHFIKDDPPPRLSVDDVTATTGATTGSSPGGTSEGADGTYTVTTGSQVGYRVVEVLFGQDTEGVGRTSAVTGSVVVAGTRVTSAEFEVDMTTVESDESRRDGQFSGRIMETSKFPTATFTLTQPIELSSIPADGTTITASAQGDLTLHGVTRNVTIPLEAKKTGSTIVISGSTDVVFADYDIDNPSTSGITTQDHGLLEFLIVAARS